MRPWLALGSSCFTCLSAGEAWLDFAVQRQSEPFGEAWPDFAARQRSEPLGETCDALVLLQGRLQHGSPPPHRVPRAGFERNLAHGIFRAIDAYLDEYDSNRSAHIARASNLRSHIDRYILKLDAFVDNRLDALRVQGTTPSNLMSSLMQLTDSSMATEFLELLHDEELLHALEAGIKNMSLTMTMLAIRTEKRITELKVLAQEGGTKEVPALVAQFFLKQDHIRKTTMKSLARTVQRMLTRLPTGYHRLARTMEQIINRVIDKTSAVTEEDAKKAVDSADAMLCNAHNGSSFGAEEPYRRLGQALSVLPMFEVYAKDKVPDAVPAVKRLTRQVLKSARPLVARLKKDMKFMTTTICDLLPVSGPSPAVRSAEAEHAKEMPKFQLAQTRGVG